eukprot:7386660-Prymnesium_polylepis.1
MLSVTGSSLSAAPVSVAWNACRTCSMERNNVVISSALPKDAALAFRFVPCWMLFTYSSRRSVNMLASRRPSNDWLQVATSTAWRATWAHVKPKIAMSATCVCGRQEHREGNECLRGPHWDTQAC